MRRRALIIGGGILFFLSFALFKIYYTRPIKEVRPEIENHIDAQFNNQFDITRIDKDYSQDLFHQPVGYKLWLKDKSDFEFGPVFMQFNTVQDGWITYGGSDIEKDYKKAKSDK